MKTRLNQTATLWDLGISDLIEETPNTSENWPTQFTIVKEDNISNVYLMRPKPSWKPDSDKRPHYSW